MVVESETILSIILLPSRHVRRTNLRYRNWRIAASMNVFVTDVQIV